MEYERRNALEWQGRASDGDSLDEVSDIDYSSEDDIPATGPHPSYLRTAYQPRHDVPSKATTPRNFAAPRPEVTGSPKGSSSHKRHSIRRLGNTKRGHMPELKRGNPAEARWRKNMEADGTFDLPIEYSELAAKLISNKGSTFANDNPFNLLDEIGKRTRTFIRTAHKDSRKIRIWATLSADLEAAKYGLRQLLRDAAAPQVTPSSNAARARGTRSNQMAKVNPETKKQAKKISDQQEAYEKKELYRREPNTIDTFSSTGTFLWPAKEMHPDDTFGHGHATLDQLRTFYECFITYDRSTSAFRVLTNHLEGLRAVKRVLKCLRTALSESATRNSVPLEVYLIDPPKSSITRTTVKMMDANVTFGGTVVDVHRGSGSLGLRKMAQLCGDKIAPTDCAEWDESADGAFARNRKIIKKAVEDCIFRMAYFRGLIRMRVHVGVFVFSKYFSPNENSEIPTVGFMSSINDSNTKGGLEQVQLNDKNTDHLFARIRGATSLLEPIDISTSSLGDVTPAHTGMFQFPLGTSEYLVCHVNIAPTSGDEAKYERVRTQWTRHSRMNLAPLQLYMIPLQKKLAWNMQISAENHIEEARIEPDVLRFSAAVGGMRSKSSSLSNRGESLIFDVPKKARFPKMKTYFQQRTTWQYRLKANSAYIFEVARYDKFDTETSSTINTSASTLWGFTLWCTSWDEKFVENVTLKLGDRAEWKPSVDEFFPRNRGSSYTGQYSGFDDYLNNLRATVDFLSETFCPDESQPEPDRREISEAPLLEL